MRIRRCLQRLCADGKFVACEMTTGDHFCTFSILFEINSEASVVAKTHCEVLILTKEDLDEVLSNHRYLIKYALATVHLAAAAAALINLCSH